MVKKTAKKKYIPNSKEKYMCAKHKKFFTERLIAWRKEIVKSKAKGISKISAGNYGGKLGKYLFKLNDLRL